MWTLKMISVCFVRTLLYHISTCWMQPYFRFIYFNWQNCKCGHNILHFHFNLLEFQAEAFFWRHASAFEKRIAILYIHVFLQWIAIYRYFDIIAQPYHQACVGSTSASIIFTASKPTRDIGWPRKRAERGTVNGTTFHNRLTSLAFEKSLESQPLDFLPPVACI
jgi:hypothetical protein